MSLAGASSWPAAAAAEKRLACARKPTLGSAREDLLQARGQRAGEQPDGRQDRHPGVALALHLEDHHGAEHQRRPRPASGWRCRTAARACSRRPAGRSRPGRGSSPRRRRTGRWRSGWGPSDAVLRNSRHERSPSRSCSMKRPARVPASTAVRMNSASNRMAKWYQNAIIALPPMTWEKMCAMPTASVGAPPAREMMVVSPTSWAVLGDQLGRDREAHAR